MFTFNYLGKPHCTVYNGSNIENLPSVPSTAYEELASISIKDYLKGWRMWLEEIFFKDVKVYEVKNLPIYCVAKLNTAIPLSKS